MAVTSFINPGRVDVGVQPAELPPQGFLDVVPAAFRNTRENFNSNSAQRLFQEERSKNLELTSELLGREIRPTDASGYKPQTLPEKNPTIYDFSREFTFDGVVDRVNQQEYDNHYINVAVEELKAKDPVKYASIKNIDELHQAAREQANLSREEYEKTLGAAPSGLDRFVGSLVGGLGAAATDPVNVAVSAIPFGNAKSVGVLGFMAREALINAGAETAIQPFVAEWQQELGQDYGFLEAAENVAVAALFGATLGGVAKGTKPAASWMYTKMSNMAEMPSAAKTASKYLSKVAHIKENIPFVGKAKGETMKRHMDSADAAAGAVVRGEPVKSEDIKITDGEFMSVDTTVKPEDSPVTVTQKEELARYQEVLSEQVPTTESVDAARPTFNVETLPQQVLNKGQKEGNLTRNDFLPEELEMLKSAGVEPNGRGQIRKGALKDEYTRRERLGALEDINGKELTHIDDYNRQLDQNIKQQSQVDVDAGPTLKAAEQAEDVFGAEPMRVDAADELNRKAESPETFDALIADFERLGETDPGLVISLDDGDIRLKDLLGELAEQQRVLNEITQCGTE